MEFIITPKHDKYPKRFSDQRTARMKSDDRLEENRTKSSSSLMTLPELIIPPKEKSVNRRSR